MAKAPAGMNDVIRGQQPCAEHQCAEHHAAGHVKPLPLQRGGTHPAQPQPQYRPSQKAAHMRDHVRSRAEANEHEYEHPRRHCPRKKWGGGPIFAPRREGLHRDQPQSARHHSRSAQAFMRGRVNYHAGVIPGHPGQECGQHRYTGSKPRMAKPSNSKPVMALLMR